MSEDITIRRLDADGALQSVHGLADVLIDCVEGGASVNFMLPIARDTAVEFWRKVAASVARGERALLVAQDADGRVLGTVQMILDLPENQRHRADVAKMLVMRAARRRGIAEKLLTALEVEARKEGRHVLVLDTITGGDAERLYSRAGWSRVGVIPDYALKPTGEYCATTYFYKHIAVNAE